MEFHQEESVKTHMEELARTMNSHLFSTHLIIRRLADHDAIETTLEGVRGDKAKVTKLILTFLINKENGWSTLLEFLTEHKNMRLVRQLEATANELERERNAVPSTTNQLNLAQYEKPVANSAQSEDLK